MAKTLDITTEGVWNVIADGSITFTPKDTFKDSPSDVEYTVKDTSGNTSNRATVKLEYEKLQNAHVFVIGGQNNAVGTTAFTEAGDVWDANVYQIAREISITGNRDESLASIEGKSLDNNNTAAGATATQGRPSFQTEFVRRYIADNPGIPIVLIPCAGGGTTFVQNYWNVGDPYYNDLINRTDNALLANPTWTLKGILWHQGEGDSGQGSALLSTIQPTFQAWHDKYGVPILLGEWVPQWTIDNGREAGERSMQDVPGVIPNTYVVSSHVPTALPQNPSDPVHFSHVNLIELGKRYYDAFLQMQTREVGATFHCLIGADNHPFADISNGTACTFENDVEHPLAYGKIPEVTSPNMPITPVANTADITVCCVVKTKNYLITSGTRGAKGASFITSSTGGMSLIVKTSAGSSPGLWMGSISAAAEYTFLSYSLASNGDIKALCGFPSATTRSVNFAREVIPRNIGIGNAYLNTSTWNNQSEIAEVIIFNSAKTLVEMEAIRVRSRARLAKRGIIVD